MPTGEVSVEHEFVSAACVHRNHSQCQPGCPHCDAVCLCVCHRWAIPVRDEPVEDA
jgi:hypothetical protein